MSLRRRIQTDVPETDLSLDGHNHLDDYCCTLGGVRKVHILALVTSPYN